MLWSRASLPPAAFVPGIDPELAAMLEREVRAGAPPIESIESITLPDEPAVPEEGIAVGGDVHAAKAVSFPTRGVVLAEAEAIDLPSPTVAPPPIQTPLPVTPAPMRIGAVIIDGAPAPAGTATTAVGPAGELIVSEQSTVPMIIAPGGRDVLPPGPGVRPPAQPVPQPQPLAADQRTIIINRLDEVRDVG